MSFFAVSDSTIALSVFIVTLLVWSVISNWFMTRSYPAGPVGLPLLGYGPFLGKKPNIILTKLHQVYGDIFSIYIGPQLNIVINNYQHMKEILNHPFVLAKPPNSFKFMVGEGGFASKNGEEWQEQRRFVMQTMRNLGLGKGVWEKMIQEDALDFITELKTRSGQPIEFEKPLSLSQVKNILSLLFGRHLDPVNDKENIELMKKFGKTFMKHISALNLNINLPWLNKWIEFFNLSGYKQFIEILHSFENIFKEEVEQRVNSKDDRVKNDFIGCYLQEMKKRENGSKPHTFTLENLRGNLFILFMAGHDSTVMSVSWLLLLMAQHPDIQEKVCREIDGFLGRDGLVYHDDRSRLPYTMATILEMMRWISINPLYPPRYVLETFRFKGYTIPKGAHLVGNSWGMMHNPKYFSDPLLFRPERFLSDGGKTLLKLEGYGPFSFGKRNCPGEGVAMMTMYIYFVSIMQKFSIRAPDGRSPDLEYEFAAGLQPNPQELCFVER